MIPIAVGIEISPTVCMPRVETSILVTKGKLGGIGFRFRLETNDLGVEI